MKTQRKEPKKKDAPQSSPPIEDYFIGHKSQCGYRRTKDDGYSLSPVMRDWFAKISTQRAGVTQLVDAVNSFAVNRLTEIQVDANRFWQTLSEDLGVNDADAVLSIGNGGETAYIKDPPKPPSASTEKPSRVRS